MRGFLTRRSPPTSRILLIESGPRPLGENAVARLKLAFGPETRIDALHCQALPPEGVEQSWSVASMGRWQLLRLLRSEAHPTAALLAAGDPIMAPWRWATLALLPAKFLIVNENADFFWLDRGNASTLVRFLQQRSGLGGESAVRSLARVLLIPLAFLYLLLYAAVIHSTRLIRLAFGIGAKAQAR